MNKRIVVIGAGGHGKVVVSTAMAAGFDVLAVLDDCKDLWGQTILGVPVEGPVVEASQKYRFGVLGVGDNQTRKRLEGAVSLSWGTLIHPAATVHPTASIGVGSVVFAGAVIQPEVVMGVHGIVNTSASIDHDCVLGDFVHIAPGTNLAGGVNLGTGVFMGIGSSVIPGVKIGAWSEVGAGGVVVKALPPKVIAIGVPVRAVRRVSD